MLRQWLQRIRGPGQIERQDFGIKELFYRPDQLDIFLEHPLVPDLAAGLVEFFDAAGGTNCVSFSTLDTRSGRRFTVTVRPEDGKPEHLIIEELKAVGRALADQARRTFFLYLVRVFAKGTDLNPRGNPDDDVYAMRESVLEDLHDHAAALQKALKCGLLDTPESETTGDHLFTLGLRFFTELEPWTDEHLEAHDELVRLANHLVETASMGSDIAVAWWKGNRR